MSFARSPLVFARLALSATVLAALAVGCAPTQPTVAQKPLLPPEPQLAANVQQRVRDLDERVTALAEQSQQLPGHTEEDFRTGMESSFGDLSRILSILQGTTQSGEFRQQLRIVDSTRAELASGSQDLASEPTVDTGLRATYRALSNLTDLSFTEDKDQLNPTLDLLRGKLNELDNVHGPMHRVVAAEALDLTTQAVRQMAQSLQERVGLPPAATQPTTQPDPGAAARAD